MTEKNIKYYHQLLKPFIEYPVQKMADELNTSLTKQQDYRQEIMGYLYKVTKY
ncbi:hypothetical protein [Neobacillus sp. LXY-1]|uniref:hypothetical protein n=1 Tax=Neobacillus sp. LXY-1 TaxID=3379133 RepID=UPI003EE1E040